MTPEIKPRGISFEDTSIAFSSKSNGELSRMYLLFAAMNSNKLVNTGTGIIKTALSFRLPVKTIIKRTIYKQFCGGETIRDCEKTIAELGKFNIGTILDYSVEGEKTERGFEATAAETIATIDKAATSRNLPICVFKVTGLGPFDLLEKVQRKATLHAEEQAAYERMRARIDRICKKAYESKIKLFIDAEESWIQAPIDELTYEMMAKYNKEQAIIFNTYQMYRWDMLDNLKNAFADAQEKGYYLGAKIVRGAYMEKEARRAHEKGYKNPIQPSKAASDRDYNLALDFCLDNIDRITFCAGTHNEQSCYYLIDEMEKRGIQPNDPRVWFAQLYGMSDNISYNLADAGYNVAKYVPYGPVQAVMPYLFRRADENTAIAGQSSREYNLIRKEVARREAVRKQRR
jgi:proline dehydrogenase